MAQNIFQRWQISLTAGGKSKIPRIPRKSLGLGPKCTCWRYQIEISFKFQVARKCRDPIAEPETGRPGLRGTLAGSRALGRVLTAGNRVSRVATSTRPAGTGSRSRLDRREPGLATGVTHRPVALARWVVGALVHNSTSPVGTRFPAS